MCWHSCRINFWSTRYNTPRTFCLASYSVVFCDQCICLLPHISINHSNCIRALGCDTSDPYTTLSHTNWLIGFVGKSAPPVTFHTPVFLAARRRMFFPQHQLCCYIHRSYQWTLGRPSEQACLNRPLLAELCRHTSFGCVTTVIFRKRQAAYRMLNHPWILYIVEHTCRNWTCRPVPLVTQAVSATSAWPTHSCAQQCKDIVINFLKNAC
jgi:hypothetical protein